MTASIGNWSLTLAVLVGAGAILAAAASLRLDTPGLLRGARWLVGLFAGLMTLACGALVYALANSDFSIAYVAGYTERALPIGYKLAAFWAGQEGSILLWGWLLAVMAGVMVFMQRRRSGTEPAVTLITLTAVCTFFAALMVYAANPFSLLGSPAADGRGLNPLLQHPSMIAHPPLLFVGYAGFTIPFAMLLGALAARRTDNDWIMDTRRWLIFSWLFLSVGILLGAQWAYVELGWGGYWAWDPVENASLLPWLTATALLHSIAIQKSRGMFKRWNALLIIATFALCIFGTYLTRSGVIQSVHAFGESLVGTFFLVFLILCVLASLVMLAIHWKLLAPQRQLDSLLSKEGAFLAVNVLLTIITLTVLIGTIFPLISGLFKAEPISVGPPFYNKVVAPMAMLLLGLMAVGPLLRLGRPGAALTLRRLPIPMALALVSVVAGVVWGLRDGWSLAAVAIVAAAVGAIGVDLVISLMARRSEKPENPLTGLVRLIDANHRRYGGQLAHVGMLLMMIGIVGSSVFGVDEQLQLVPGQTATIAGYEVAYHDLTERRGPNYTAVQAHVQVTGTDGRPTTLHPQMRFYDKSSADRPHAEVALRSTLVRDVYVTLAGWEDGGKLVALEAIVNPLVSWIWIGGAVLSIAGLLCLFPPMIPEPKAVVLNETDQPASARSAWSPAADRPRRPRRQSHETVS